MAEEVGKLISKGQIENGVSKAGKQWVKLNFVIKCKGNFPREVAFTLFNDMEKINMINDTSIGTDLSVQYSPESRLYNGKYYTNLKAWKIEVVRSEDPTVNTDHRGMQEIAQMHNQQYQRATDVGNNQDDDLPF